MGDEHGRSDVIERRGFLKLVGGAAAVTALSGLEACGSTVEGPGVVEVPLESVPVGGRMRVLYGEVPVELIRNEEGVVARSLWCTHSGCEVKWVESDQVYSCACHDGEFDAAGNVTAGPPPRPLSTVPIKLTDTAILIGATA